jgi:hypothetical protein
MQRHRQIAAAPTRTASEAWQVVTDLLSDTLERSPKVPDGSVAAELTALAGLGPAMIAGGHLETDGLVLVDEGLHLTIKVLTGDKALEVEENLNPVPGGASATDGWTLYLPSPAALTASISAAAKKSKHLSAESSPADAPTQKEAASDELIDLKTLRELGGRR